MPTLWRAIAVALVQTGIIILVMSFRPSLPDALLASTTCMAALCVPNTLQLIASHVRHWQWPALQICVVRIVLMVPIYAIDSWLALMNGVIGSSPGAWRRFACSASGEWRSCGLADGVRELYGAFVIHSFVCYLVRSFGTEEQLGHILRDKHQVHHVWPLVHMLPRWKMGPSFLLRCKRGALQYVVIRLVVTVLDVALNLQASLRDSPAGSLVGDILLLLSNCSQCWAMYSLVIFYFAMRKELTPLRPLAKFACIKFVVFVTFWQTLGIELVSKAGLLDKLIERSELVSREQVTDMLKDGLLCLEMWLISLVHPLVFSSSDYRSGSGAASADSRFAPNSSRDSHGYMPAHISSMGSALHEALLRPLAPPFHELESAGGVHGVLSPHALGIVHSDKSFPDLHAPPLPQTATAEKSDASLHPTLAR